VPALDPGRWPTQAVSAAADLTARIAVLDRLATGFARSTASPDASRDHDAARLKAIFGDAFVVLPALAPALAATWPQLWGNSAALQAGDARAAQRWFGRVSRVRAGAARLDTALLYAEALAGRSLAHFDVAQLPFTAGDRWLALDLAGAAAPSSRSRCCRIGSRSPESPSITTSPAHALPRRFSSQCAPTTSPNGRWRR
jgi:hypothetical protein